MEFKDLESLSKEASRYERVSTTDLVQVFKDNHVYIPDFAFRFILINFMRKYALNKESMASYSDELKYRLNSFDKYSIHLALYLEAKYNIRVRNSEFKNLFMRFFLKNESSFETTTAFNKQLGKLRDKKNASNAELFVNMIAIFQEIVYTPQGYVDGIPIQELKDHVVPTYTLNEVPDLGKKYGVEIPKRINKAKFIELLTAKYSLSEEEQEELSKKSILDITKYAKERGLKFSTDLKKEDMVEYLIFALNKYDEEPDKDLYNYDILDVFNEDEKLVFDEEEPVVEEEAPIEVVAEEPVEEAQPVEEEPVVEEATEEAPQEEEAKVEEEEVVEEEAPEEPVVVEELKDEEEPAPIEPIEEEEDEEEEYNKSVDEEIRSIIKEYYKKKTKADRRLRTLVVILIILILGVAAVLALKLFNVI